MQSVVVVDTGLGNLRSVTKAVSRAAADGRLPVSVERSADPQVVRRADRIVYPGQGGFRDCAAALGQGLRDVLVERLAAGTPYFGICMGLQLLFGSSDEAPGAVGLGLLPGHVSRLAGGGAIKIPHMGWNAIELVSGGHPWLTSAGGAGTHFYFVHSFHALTDEPGLVRAVARHGDNHVTAAVARDNLFATQFHPEKSQRAGLALLQAFLRV